MGDDSSSFPLNQTEKKKKMHSQILRETNITKEYETGIVHDVRMKKGE